MVVDGRSIMVNWDLVGREVAGEFRRVVVVTSIKLLSCQVVMWPDKNLPCYVSNE